MTKSLQVQKSKNSEMLSLQRLKNCCNLMENGFEKEDEHGNALPVKYDAIRFYVGYNKDRDSALVEVLDARCEVFVDENNEIITYECGEDKEGNPLTWYAGQVVFDLGKILEKNVKVK